MGRLISGIFLVVLVFFAIIGILVDPEEALNTEGSREGIALVCFILFGGIFLIFSGVQFIIHRRKTIEYTIQMLRRSKEIDTESISRHIGINEIQVMKFLKHGQRKGIIPSLDGVHVSLT